MAFREVIHFDQGDVLRHEMTPEGFLNCYMRVAKTGDLQYRNADGSTRTEYVPESTLFNADSVATLKGKPVTLEHPPALLTAETAKDYLTGSTLNLVKYDGSFLGIMATIHDKPTIDAVRSGKARQVSCGYTCDLVKRADGKYEQQNRQYNHVAITRKGRAGSSVAVHMDSVSDANIWTQIRGDSMSEELYQIEIAGKVTRVDAETYELIRQEQQQRLDAEKKMTAMQEKMAKLRAMQSDTPDDDEDEELEDMPKKDASCNTRKDGYKGKSKAKSMPVVEEMEDDEDEDEDYEDEDMRKDSFEHTDSADAALLEMMIENRLLKARLDAESASTEEEDEDEEMDEEEDEEEYEDKKRKDAADVLNTWISVADELTPALIRGDSIVEGIEVEDGKLHFDSVSAIDLKEAYIKLHGLDEVLNEANRFDSVAVNTAFEVVKRSLAVASAPNKKSRSRETLDTALKSGSRHDSSDARFASIQADIEAGRKRLR